MTYQLSANFRLSEFRCHCGKCKPKPPAPALVTGLQALRTNLGKAVEVLCGWRCPERNKAVGGAKQSKHLTGEAADIRVAGMSGRELYEVARTIPQFRGFGVGANYLHVDCRQLTARWVYRDGKQAPWVDA